MVYFQKNLAASSSRTRKLLFIALIVCFSLVFFLAACSPAGDNMDDKSVSPGEEQSASATTILSTQDLEAEYGMRVSLVAVTAAGGLVDVRIKLVDPEKARILLEKPENFPTLWIDEAKVTLKVPKETSDQDIQYDPNATMFLLFANAGNAVKPGTPVAIVFGDVQLEPINAQ